MLRSVFAINGQTSRKVKYGLYAFYMAMFLLLWQAGGNLVKPWGDIFHSLGVLWFEKGYGHDIIQSMHLNLVALFYTTLLVLFLSYFATFPAFRPIAYFLSKGRFLGLMGLNAIFIEAFGLGFELKVSLLVFSIGVFYLTSMFSVIIEIPQEKFDYARNLNLNNFEVMWHVIIRGTLDKMLENLRQCAAIGWMMLTAVEGIVKSGGIGDILYNSYKHFDRGEVLAIILSIIFIGILQDIILKFLQKIVCPYMESKP